MKIAITGSGIVSAIGVGKSQTLESLRAGRSGLAPVHYLQTSHHECMVGEVKLTNEEMIQQLGLQVEKPVVRTSLLGMLALREAIEEAGLLAKDLGKMAFVNGTTVGGMDKSEQYYLDFFKGTDYTEYIRLHDCGSSTQQIADYAGKFGAMTCLSTACSSAANAIILGSRLLQSGEYDRVVVGGAESLSKFHLNGFNTLMILDQQPCRPMDASRAGLNLGEGAAYLVLETESSAQKRGAKILGYLAGYGNACDAFHQTASSPEGEGAYLAMQQALQLAGVKPSEVDYINCHGTGTPNNDPSELQAMKRLFGTEMPMFSSTKGYTGHTTSASGSIEAVFCLLAIQNGFVPDNHNYTQQPIEQDLVPVAQLTSKSDLNYILCNAFGFGGNDSSVLFSKQASELPSIDNGSREVYVVAANQISMQAPLSEAWMADGGCKPTEDMVKSQDPDFKPYVSPGEARRLGKLLKRALAVSLQSMRQAGIEHPDAIITGTGLGSVESTEAFLLDMCQNGEELLKPTYFMQSTHNTIGSLVSISTKSHGYNATYSHKTISFESALEDAWLQMQEGCINSALVGGHDGLTERYYELLKQTGMVGQPGMAPASEAAAAVLLSVDSQYAGKALCKLCGVKLLYKPTEDEVQDTVSKWLANQHLSVDDCQFGSVAEYEPLFGRGFSTSALAFYASAHLQAKNGKKACLLRNQSETGDVSLVLLMKS